MDVPLSRRPLPALIRPRRLAGIATPSLGDATALAGVAPIRAEYILHITVLMPHLSSPAALLATPMFRHKVFVTSDELDLSDDALRYIKTLNPRKIEKYG